MTYRQLTLIDYEYKGNALIFIPIFETKEIIDENALLYGKRYIFDNLSLSYSGGISVMNREFTARFDENEQRIYEKETYFGFPFELNIKWFKPKKRRLRIYYVIPVGQPTSFGGSFGFKIIGNVSKQSFVGIGISYGYGWHKIY